MTAQQQLAELNESARAGAWRPVKIYNCYIVSLYDGYGRWLSTVRGKTGRKDSIFRTLESAQRKADNLNTAALRKLTQEA